MNALSLKSISYASFLFLVVSTTAVDGMFHTIFGPAMMAAAPLALMLLFFLLFTAKKIETFIDFHFFVLLYILWSSISYVWTTTPEITALRLLAFNFSTLFVFPIFWYHLKNYKNLNQAYLYYLVAIFYLGTVTVSNFNNGIMATHYSGSGRFSAYDIGTNEMAIMLSCAITIALYLYTVSKSKITQLIAVSSVPIMSYAAFLTGSRTGFITLFVGLLFVIFPLAKAKGAGKLMISAVIVLGVILIAELVPEDLILRIFSTGQSLSTGNLNEREVVWQIGLDAWEEQPFIGRGVDSFDKMSNHAHMDLEAHNTYLSILVEYGIVGFMLYMSILVSLFFYILKVNGIHKFLMLFLMFQLLVAQMTTNLQDNAILWSTYALMISHCWIILNKRFE